MINDEPTIQDVLDTVNTFASAVDKRFNEIDGRMDKLDGRMDKLDGRMDKLETRVTHIGSQMVTKDYLDEKLADLRGDLVVMMRKEDSKLKELVMILSAKNILTPEDTKKILTLEPFAQLSLS